MRTNSHAGFIVVERRGSLPAFSDCVSLAGSKIGLSESSQIALRRFRGLEGLVWPGETEKWRPNDDEALVSPQNPAELLKRVSERAHGEGWELLWCQILTMLRAPSTAPVLSQHMGFDLVLAPFAHDGFSSVLNEVVLGTEPSLMRFRGALNEHLLFPGAEQVLEFGRVRDDLLRHGIGRGTLEVCSEGEEFLPVSVFRIPG